MLKFFGIFLVFISVCVYGNMKALKIKEKLRQQDGFLSFLKYVRICVSTNGTPLCDIYRSFNNDTLQKSGFIGALTVTDSTDGIRYALERCKKSVLLDKADVDALCEFASAIQTARSRDEGEKLCDKYIGILELNFCSKREENEKKAELYKKLSVLVALSSALLLL